MDANKLKNYLKILTITQKRRILYYLDGMTLKQIAEKEKVSITAIYLSIRDSRKKIKKFKVFFD